VTDMRTAISKVGAAIGVSVLVASAGVAASQAVASAEPAAHQVRYTLSVTGPGNFNLFYAIAAPPNKAAYEADPYAFVKSEKVNLSPDAPWVFETTLTDPQAAMVNASGAAHAMQADPNPHCVITVDGQVVMDQTGPFAVQCQLRPW
jgi:hypothetical protein